MSEDLDFLGQALITAGLFPPWPGDRIPAVPEPIGTLRLDPRGLWDLRRHLGPHATHPGLMALYRHRFRASDIAFLSHGAHSDGNHAVQPLYFHTDHTNLFAKTEVGGDGPRARKDLRNEVRALLWDTATKLDRLSGSTTIVIHTPGATVPNTPPLPEYLKAFVYLPPSFLAQNPAAHRPIARIVQSFIENVGVPTVRGFTVAFQHRYHLPESGSDGAPMNDKPGHRVIPRPKHNSSMYVFEGQPYGYLDRPAIPTPAPLPVIDIPDDDDDDGADDALEWAKRVSELQEELAAAKRFIEKHCADGKRESKKKASATSSSPAAPPTPSRAPRTAAPADSQPHVPPPYSPSPSVGRRPSAQDLRNAVDRVVAELHLDQWAPVIRVIVGEPMYSVLSWRRRLIDAGVPASTVDAFLLAMEANL
uniref:Uncharacterized protein n=1 Tax=Mycena chlorophos TaxID=658473 RepID=A0ABQ0L5Q1_MYCCL|nr:predicted protein [Mycena chlorophos]